MRDTVALAALDRVRVAEPKDQEPERKKALLKHGFENGKYKTLRDAAQDLGITVGTAWRWKQRSGKYFSYSLKFKERICAYAAEHGLSRAAADHGVARQNVKRWWKVSAHNPANKT